MNKVTLVSLFRNSKMSAEEPGDLSGTLTRLGSIAQEYFEADICVIFPMNPVTRTFLREKPTTIGKLASATPEDVSKPREKGLAKLVLSKKALFIENQDIDKYQSPITQIEKIRAFAAFGLFTSRLRAPLAVIFLDYKGKKKFDEKFLASISSFVELASGELQNTWFIRRYRDITQVGQHINESFENIDQMFDKVHEHLKGILDVHYSFSLLNYDDRTKKADLYLNEEGEKHIHKDYELLENSASSWVLKNLRTIAFDDFYKEKQIEGLQAVHIPGTASKERSVIFVPIKIIDKPFGVLSIQHPRRKYYDKEDRQILELLANHIALALNNNRLLDDMKGRRLQELEDLRQIDKEISRTLDLDIILKTILKLTSKHIKADSAVILLHNKKFNAIEVKAFEGLSSQPADQRLDQYKGIIKSAFELKETIRINDVRGDQEWKDKYIEFSKDTNSELAVPLILGEDIIGVMNFESNEKNAYSEDSQWFIETLAGQAVIAIKNATEYKRTKRIAQEREALIRVANELMTQSDFTEIFSIILERALEITETSYGTISECDEERRKIRNITAKGGVDETWRDEIHGFDEGIKGKVARDKRYTKIDNLTSSPLRSEYLDVFQGKMNSLLAVPILEGDRIRGVINLESENPYHFEEDDVELVHSLATLCAVALRAVGSIQQKQLASVGVITGDIYHKMNSPLAKIQKLIEIIQIDNEVSLRSNDALKRKINTIHSIISDTIDLVKQKIDVANRSFIKSEKISLKDSVKRAIEDTELPKNITIENHVESQSINILATPQLASVFQNFIANAIRAMMPDGGKIFFDIDSVDDSWVIISVENTGRGIPEHLRPLVFETSDRGEGHGFGLRWTKAYIEMHGGKIDIPTSGREGKGTKFVLYLKRA